MTAASMRLLSPGGTAGETTTLPVRIPRTLPSLRHGADERVVGKPVGRVEGQLICDRSKQDDRGAGPRIRQVGAG